MAKSLWLAAGVAWLAAGGAVRGEVVATARSAGGEFPEFRVVLDVAGAPAAVANFMGLADGSQAWLDPDTGRVRGGEGDAFYDGMVFDWHMGSLLRGGLREMTRDGITEHTGGPGYTLRSETGESGWSEVEEGSLVLVERRLIADGALVRDWAGWFGDMFELDVRHSGGAELGLFLTNGVVPWTVFGHVPEEDRAGLRALAAAVGQGATEVRWTVDTSGMTAAEREALDAARAELPSVRGVEARVDNKGPVWERPGKSLTGISVSTNLMAEWHHLTAWNETRETAEFGVSWGLLGWKEGGKVVTLDGGQGFASFTEAEHPAMAGAPLGGKWRIGVAGVSGETFQYWLDFDKGTGMWARLEGGEATSSGELGSVACLRETANSICVRFILGMTLRFYWFGVVEDGAAGGLFQAAQIVVDEEIEIQKDSGSYVWAEGWGDEAEEQAMKSGKRGAVPFQPGGRPLPGGRSVRRGMLTFEP